MNRSGKSSLSEEVFRSSPQTDVRRGMVRSGWGNSARPEALALSQDYNVSTDVLVRRRKECFSSLIHSSVRTVRSVCEVDCCLRVPDWSAISQCSQKGTFIIGRSSLITRWDNVFLNNLQEKWQPWKLSVCRASFMHYSFISIKWSVLGCVCVCQIFNSFCRLKVS